MSFLLSTFTSDVLEIQGLLGSKTHLAWRSVGALWSSPSDGGRWTPRGRVSAQQLVIWWALTVVAGPLPSLGQQWGCTVFCGDSSREGREVNEGNCLWVPWNITESFPLWGQFPTQGLGRTVNNPNCGDPERYLRKWHIFRMLFFIYHLSEVMYGSYLQ